MGRRDDSPLVESKHLGQMVEGSYEERMFAVQKQLIEDEERLFGGDVSLIATFPSKVIVMDEDGNFFSAEYSVYQDNSVRFKRPENLKVPLITEGSLKRGAVESFFQDGKIEKALSKLVTESIRRGKSLLETVAEDLETLLSGGALWRTYLEENREKFTSVAFESGAPKVNSFPLFDDIYEDSEDSQEERRSEVLSALAGLEGRLVRLSTQVTESFSQYQSIASGMRDQEADQLLSRFEGFADDYLEHLNKVGGFVSESIGKGKSGCVACSALIHDEVIKHMPELVLGGRLIRKISTEFARD